MRNIDKIKSMLVDEMAELLIGDCENYCNAKNCEGDCPNNVKQWLLAESESEG